MTGDVAKLEREATIRKALPENVKAIVDASATDPGAPFVPAAVSSLKKLRAEDMANWTRARTLFAGIAGVLVGELDKLTAPKGVGDSLQGEAIEWDDPDPWPEPVDGAALLDGLRDRIEHYADMPAGGAVAVALWALYSWCHDSFPVSPNLMITAPERESGKTQVTELLSWMVRRPSPVSDASAAAIIRGIAADRPTLLFDEAQSFLKRKADDPIRGVLLASFTRRFAYVQRVEGESNERRRFDTFTPKAMNGRKLAAVDDMLTSRSLVIAMTRATRRLPELRSDRDPIGEDARAQCRRWAADQAATLRDADPDTGGRIGRVAQVWRPLFAIADAAGGSWPTCARTAADALSASAAAVADGDTLGVMLLADVREVFADQDTIKSEELDRALVELSERPWATLGHGDRKMTPQARGRMLAAYGIRTVEVPGRRKGYRREQFESAWTAYLPDGPGESNRGTVETLENKGFRETSNRGDGFSLPRFENNGNSLKQETSTVPRFENRGARGNGADSAPAQVALPEQPPGTETAGDAYRRMKRGS